MTVIMKMMTVHEMMMMMMLMMMTMAKLRWGGTLILSYDRHVDYDDDYVDEGGDGTCDDDDDDNGQAEVGRDSNPEL